MGGGGTTTSQGTIDPTLQPLYRGSSNQLLAYQQQNPLTGYATPNPRGTAGLSPYESAGLQAMGGLFNASPWEALAAQSIMAAPGVARQGPTTGSYGYGGLQDMQSIYNMLGTGNPLQTRVNGGGYGSPAPPSGPPVAPPQPPPTGGTPGAGGGGPGGPDNPPVAQAMGSTFSPDMESAFPSVTPNGQGGYEVSQSMTPPPSAAPGWERQAQFLPFSFRQAFEGDEAGARNFLEESGINAGFADMQARRRASQAERGLQDNPYTQLSNQVYEQGVTVRPGGGLQTDQGTHNWSGPRIMEAIAQFSTNPEMREAAMRGRTNLAAVGAPTMQLNGQTVLAPTAAQARANAAQAGYAAQAAAHPANQPGAARFDTPGASQMPGGASQATTSAATGNAAGGAAAPPPAATGTAADQARILRQQRGQPVTVTRR